MVDTATTTGTARSIARREWLILVVVWLWCFDLAVHFELSTVLHSWTRRHESTNLDELLLLAGLGFLGLLLFAWHRHLHDPTGVHAPEPGPAGPELTAESYRSLFEYHSSAVFSLDFGGGFTSTNAACEQITGYAADQLAEMTFYDLVAKGDVLATEAGFVRALDRHPQQLELSIVHADGHRVELSVTGLPIVVGEVVIGVLGIAEDISAAKRLERDLVRTRVQAEQANEAKSLFLANVSEEIRHPVSTMLDTTEQLRDTGLDPEGSAFVDSVDRSGKHLLGLADQILEFTRNEASSCAGGVVPFDVRVLVGAVAAKIRPEAQRKGLFFKCTVDPRIPLVVEGDPGSIAQVLTNLLENASRFTESGWIRLVVTSAHNFGDRVSIRFEVHDSGIGASKDQERRLYLAFSQLTPPAADGNEDLEGLQGSGLGLGISQQLVTSMGGALALSSSPGLGSAFSFTLRFSLPDAAAPGAHAAL